MLDKVYIVEQGEWLDDPYVGWNQWDIDAICDTFESACNYIRSCLTKTYDDYKKCYEEQPDYYPDLSLDEAFRFDYYAFDPNNLPDNEQFDVDKLFVYYGTDEKYDNGKGFIIREHEIKHYD